MTGGIVELGLVLLIAYCVIGTLWKIGKCVSECWDMGKFEVYAREWVRSEYPELSPAGEDALVKYLVKKMKNREDKWDVELYVPTSTYKRIEREYRLKEE